MDIYGQIKKAIQDMSGNENGQSVFFTVEITAVDGQTCSGKLGTLELTGIRLRAVVNSSTDQVILKPTIGSNVLVADLSNGQFRELVVFEYSEVEEYSLKIGETTIKATSSGIELHGHQFGGLVKISDLVTKLNRLENAFLTHVHTGSSGPTGIQLIVVEETGNYDLDISVQRNTLGQISQGFVIGSTLYQNQAMILRTQPGQLKENLTAGVGLEDIVNDNEIDYWKRRIVEQFEADGQRIGKLQLSSQGLIIDAKYK